MTRPICSPAPFGLEHRAFTAQPLVAPGERSLRSGAPPDIELLPDLDAEHICVVARAKRLIEDTYAPALRSHGIDTVFINTDASDALGPGVRIASMHRVKGLEFPRMILAGVQKGTMPFEDAAYTTRDETARALDDEDERKLIYVAATRARDVLVITGNGQRSPHV